MVLRIFRIVFDGCSPVFSITSLYAEDMNFWLLRLGFGKEVVVAAS